ncbi:MAG TPA: N-acetylmuramoyl-L-alanine amidase [Candidatus Omnitrophota bacterium]|nr:N-acetylmuramoyl-L-alanine amidase [Candidatus Omnitrophota bacterium]
MAVLAALVAALATFGAQAATAVTATRLGIHPDGVTRFVMDLSDRLDFTVSSHADPMRIVVNTDGLAWSAPAIPAKTIGSVARLKEENGRIVLTLAEPAEVKTAFVIPPRDGLGWRFVMDLKQTTKVAFLASAKPAAAKVAKATPVRAEPVRAEPVRAVEPAPAPTPAPVAERQPQQPIVLLSPAAEAQAQAQAPAPMPVAAPPPQPAPAPVRLAAPEPRPAKGTAILSAAMPPPMERPVATPAVMTAPAPEPMTAAPAMVTKVAATIPAPEPEAKGPSKNGDGRPVIVLDPGHGGVDPGAIGVSGVYEKFITLAAARELKEQLERSGRYKVHLTRDRDIFIRLRDRVALARQYNADLFISLHADAVQNPQIKGLSVYTLSQNASDAEAAALADKENKVDLIAGIDLSHESADVANILIDLAQRETLNRSAGFAGGIVDELGREITLLNNTHRFAGFAVLKAPDVPAVLIELGYLSNEYEERNLRQPVYREKIAKSISRAIDGFFLQGQKAKRP